MTDFVLKSPDKDTMYAAFSDLGIYDTETETLRTQGLLDDGTAWALVDQGVRTYPTGDLDDDGEPIMASDEYWVALRWNGGAPLPDDRDGVEIVWRSDVEEPGDYPEGVTRFA